MPNASQDKAAINNTGVISGEVQKPKAVGPNQAEAVVDSHRGQTGTPRMRSRRSHIIGEAKRRINESLFHALGTHSQPVSQENHENKARSHIILPSRYSRLRSTPFFLLPSTVVCCR
jgi:hypothetical protein